jgi:hypothetical protein
MSCRNCGSERIARVNAKSNDLNFLEIPHLNIDHDGYLPTLDEVFDGDYVNFALCLECGMIQGNSFPLTDEAIITSLRGDDDDEEDWDDDWRPHKPEPDYTQVAVVRLDDKSNEIYKAVNPSEFMHQQWVLDIAARESFHTWAVTEDPNNGTTLLAVLYINDEVVIERVGYINTGRFTFDPLPWASVTPLLKS